MPSKRQKYQKKVAMAQETITANAKKQSNEDTTVNEDLSSAAFAEQGK